jgi:hypothetical protein
LALLEPMRGQAPDKPVADRSAIGLTTRTPNQTVRVVGAPFEPNVNPRQR